MKKIALFSALALCLGFTSCDNYEEPNPPAQSNPQAPVVEVKGIQVTPAVDGSTVDLGKYAAEGTLVPVAKLALTEAMPADMGVSFVGEIAKDDTFENAQSVPTTLEDGVIYIAPEDINAALINLYGKEPLNRSLSIRLLGFANIGTSVARLGGEDYFFGEETVTAVPVPLGYVVEKSYSLTGTFNTELTSNSPEDVYANPTFFGSFEVEVDQTVQLGIKAQSGKVFGLVPDGDDLVTGKLDENAGLLNFSSPGPWLITINLEEGTYTIKQAFPVIYAYFSSAKDGMELDTYNYVNYSGFLCGRGTQTGFKLANEKVAKPSITWGTNEDGDMVMGGETSMQLENGGCNWLKVNLSELTFEAVHIEYFELIGGWDPNWGEPIKMTTDKKFTKWTCELTITAGTEFKLRTNGTWDDPNPNFGGAMDALVEHGGNLVWPAELGDGTFTVTLDLSTVPYTLTAVKK